MTTKVIQCLVMALVFAMVSVSLIEETEGASAFDKANKKSVQGLDALPRWGFPEEINATAPVSYQIDYFIGLFLASGLFLIFAALSFVLWPFWMACRCCHCLCCKKKKHTKEFSCLHKWGYLVFILINCALMVSFSIIAYVANGQFSDAVVNEDDGMLQTVQILLEDLGDFVNETVFEPLDFIKEHTIEAVDDVNDLLDGSSVITNGTQGMVEELEAFESDWANHTIVIYADSGASYTFICDVCTEVSSVVGDTADQITNETNPLFNELNDTITGIQTKLIAVRDNLVDTITDVSESMEDLTSDIFEMDEDFEEKQRPVIEKGNSHRELGYNILFAAPLIAFVPVILGALFKRPACFTFAYSLMWLNFFVMFFMLALHLPFALLLNDVCNYMDEYDSNLQKIKNDTLFELAQACLDDTPVAQVFGIDDELDFISIDFPAFNSSDITTAFDFSALDDFEGTMNNTDIDTFGGIVEDGLEATNELVAACTCPAPYTETSDDYYSRENISDLIALHYFNKYGQHENVSYWALNATAEGTVDMMSAEENGEVQFQNVIDGMSSDLEGIANTSAELEKDITLYFERVNSAEEVLTPIFDKAEDIINNGKCGFIGTAYYSIKSSMCTDILASLSTMVLCMLLIGIFSFLSCVFSIKMVRRIKPLMEEGFDNDTGAQRVIILDSSGKPNYGHALYVSEK